MTRVDYIRFLSENAWIWATEPGWAMEEKLKNQPDLFEMKTQNPCVTCSARYFSVNLSKGSRVRCQ